MNKQNYKVAMYLRLSKEDENSKESNSIISQREIIKNYIEENNLNLTNEYVDDGISGTTFNRNGFNQLIRDIIEKKINMVVVKDLSRLGRDHIEFGMYVEKFFPENKVRLVALGDMYDSDNSIQNNTTMILFKSMYNEMYVKDISDKIKMSISNKRKMGYFLGPTPPYGYNKDKYDHHKLVIDPYSSSIVKKIFHLYIEGNSISKICKILTSEKIEIPSVYKKLNRGLKSLCYGEWTSRTITDIITNPTYIGNLTQGRLKKVNYKSKKIIHTKKEDWITTYNTCPKIIDENIFKQAQKIYSSGTNKNRQKQDILLKGIVKCKECGHTIGFRIQKSNTKKYGQVKRIYGNCNYYIKHRYSNICTPHSVNYQELENIIITKINNLLTKIDDSTIISISKKIKKEKEKNNKLLNELKNIDNQIILIKHKLDITYMDKLNNEIDVNMYKRIKRQLTKELEDKEIYKEKIQEKLNNDNYNIEDNIKKHLKITRNLLINIIDYITIDENKNIEIYYKINDH